MSGTSIDGVDVANILTDGRGVLEFGAHAFRAYRESERAAIRSALGCWPGNPEVPAAEEVVLAAHGKALRDIEVGEVIGFHGHTLAHDPANGRTHQVGDGQMIAKNTRATVVWDFRTADMRQGGQGAPLAPFYHFALARKLGMGEPGIMLNIGGVANISWIDPCCRQPEDPDALLAFDTGPGNAAMDDLVRLRTGENFDAFGNLARKGQPSGEAVAKFLENPYFSRKPPKSLDREDFRHIKAAIADLDTEDALATLAECTVSAIHAGFRHLPVAPQWAAVCGGGRRNNFLMERLNECLPAPVYPIEQLGVNGDVVEAQAFAFLAVRMLRGLPGSSPSTTGCVRPSVAGRKSTRKPMV